MAAYHFSLAGQYGCRRRAVTLIELLVVIVVIAILIGLLLPAVQGVREVARLVQCGNQVKQLALGVNHAVASLGSYPSSGWGIPWQPDPDRGYGPSQPGGWGFAILPFIEQQPLYDLGAGGTASVKAAANKTLIETPLAIWNCPTRRPAKLYPVNANVRPPYDFLYQPRLTARLSASIRSDYCLNGGEQIRNHLPYPPSLHAVDQGGWNYWPSVSDSTGVSFVRSRFTPESVLDGLSQTYLLGEKSVNPDMIERGISWGDDQNPYSGDDFDCVRFTRVGLAPVRDTPGLDVVAAFGSGHMVSFMMAMCDGSVRRVDFDVDPVLHARLGNRRDRQP